MFIITVKPQYYQQWTSTIKTIS